METVVCPNCGNEIHIRFFTPKSIACDKCKEDFVAEYEDEDGNIHQGGWDGFKVVHPKIAKAIAIAGGTAIGTLVIFGLNEVINDKVNELVGTSTSSMDSTPYADEINQGCISDTILNSQDAPTDYNEETIPVVGCKVRLSGNRRASQQKREEAAANGYPDLGEHETWRVPSNRTIKTPVKEE